MDDICRALEEDAAENELPVEFFARVIWQESRFNARAVSRAGAQGIAQFMPRTADWRGLADPFDPIGALRHSASYLRDLRNRFGNLGLAAAGYNAGPGRVSEWLAGRRSLPSETRNYVAIVTGWTADEWASSSPPETAETTIPQGLPCTRLANLILAPKEEAQRIAGYVPRWGAQLTSNWSESRAWATYRALQKQYASLIGDREPIVLHGRLPGMGSATRYYHPHRRRQSRLSGEIVRQAHRRRRGLCRVAERPRARVTAFHSASRKAPLCRISVRRPFELWTWIPGRGQRPRGEVSTRSCRRAA